MSLPHRACEMCLHRGTCHKTAVDTDVSRILCFSQDASSRDPWCSTCTKTTCYAHGDSSPTQAPGALAYACYEPPVGNKPWKGRRKMKSYGKVEGKSYTQHVRDFVAAHPELTEQQVLDQFAPEINRMYPAHPLKMATVAFAMGKRGATSQAAPQIPAQAAPAPQNTEQLLKTLESLGIKLEGAKPAPQAVQGWIRPVWADYAAMHLRERHNVMLYGPSGTGKSFGAEMIAMEVTGEGKTFEYTFNEESPSDDIVGGLTLVAGPTGSESRWQDGILTACARTEDGVFVANEINAITSGTAFAMYRFLEHKPVTIPQTLEVVPMKALGAIGTTNALGHSEGDHRYGLNSMSEAMRQRFHVAIYVDYPTEAEERKMIASQVPGADEGQIKKILAFAKVCREASKAGALEFDFGIRVVLNMLWELSRGVDLGTSVTCNVRNKLPTDTQAKCTELAQRVFGAAAGK